MHDRRSGPLAAVLAFAVRRARAAVGLVLGDDEAAARAAGDDVLTALVVDHPRAPPRAVAPEVAKASDTGSRASGVSGRRTGGSRGDGADEPDGGPFSSEPLRLDWGPAPCAPVNGGIRRCRPEPWTRCAAAWRECG